MQQLGGAPPGLFGPGIGARVEQLVDERAAQVVRTEAWHAGAVGAVVETQQHRLRSHGAPPDMAALGHRREQGAGPRAAAERASRPRPLSFDYTFEMLLSA